MQKYFLILFLSLQSLLTLGQRSAVNTADLVITNVSVITMKTNKVLNNQDVVIKTGKIMSIKKHTNKKYKNVMVIDGKNKYILPTLSDAHVHFPETEAEFERVLQLNLINGVTKLRSMRGDWKHIDWRKKYNNVNSFYPKLYLSPPPISRNYDLTTPQIDDFVKSAKQNGFDFIKILSIKDQQVFSELDSFCRKYNINISGHYLKFPNLNEIDEELLFTSNYNSFEHLGGLAGESVETINRRIQWLKSENIFICPTLLWYSIGSGQYSVEELRTLPGMEFISKAQMEEWIEGTNKYRKKIGDVVYKDEVATELKSLDEKYLIIRRLNEAGINMILSPDASSKYMIAGFNMLSEMKLLQKANLSNFEILKMTTVNFATFFNEDYGTIEVNKNADFLILNNNPLEDLQALKNINSIYFNRQFLDSKALEAMKLDLLQSANN